MITTNYEFDGSVYPCRVVKDNTGEDLIIGSTAFLDVLQPGSLEDEDEGFACEIASEIYDEIFYFTSEENLRLSDAELIEVLKESNPDWFD